MEDPQQHSVDDAKGEPGEGGADTGGSSPNDPTTPEDLSKPVGLAGYPRKGDPPGVRRLYQHTTSDRFVEIDTVDIVEESATDVGLEPGEIRILVRSDANVRLDGQQYLVSEVPTEGRPTWPRR